MDAAIVRTLPSESRAKRLNIFQRYLAVWVGLCMVAGIVIGRLRLRATPARMEFGEGSHVNFPIAVLIWLMIIPMMMKVDLPPCVMSASGLAVCW